MGNFRKNVKKASMARGKVDKAQNQLLKGMKKDIDELKSTVEAKYGYQIISDYVASFDGSTEPLRSAQIYTVDIGSVQGTSDNNNRIGDQVTLKHIDLDYRINLLPPRSTEYIPPQTTVRVFMFWDNQPISTSLAGAPVYNPVYWTDLLQLANPGTTTGDQKQLLMLSKKKWDQGKRFSVIYDKTHTLASNQNALVSATSTGGNGPRCTTSVVSFSKNYQSQKIRYIAGGTIPQNRRLYYGFLSDIGISLGTAPNVITAARPIIQLQTRVIYDDA